MRIKISYVTSPTLKCRIVTVWKISNSSIPQILREINYCLKTIPLNILRLLNGQDDRFLRFQMLILISRKIWKIENF